MRWEGRRQSENVEDRRNVGQQVVVGGGLLTLVIMIVLLFLGADPAQIAQLAPDLGGPQAAPQAGADPADDEKVRFVKTVLADTEDVWGEIFPRVFRGRYVPPTLVLFTGQVRSACGFASAAAGPFYCPLDRKVYIDLAFYDELKRRFNAPGDFAEAYVIAHEIGHHVQNQLGIADEVQRERSRASEKESNALSVRMELQADFLAGVWARRMAALPAVVDEEDIREAVNAAQQIGDDRIQKRSQGYVVPDAFTHGSADQRARWFIYGLKTEDPADIPDRMARAFQVETP
ncbi:MAG: neutral zinc metallopeptidase [Planctomycetaceae bacterium]